MPEDDLVADRPTSWPVSATRYLHRGDWVISLREDVVGRPRQPQDRFVRWTVEHPGAVVVLAVDDDERVFCLRQYRHPGRHEFVELPAGLRDEDGEDPLLTAQRELREEAELAAVDWRLLLSTYPSAGLTEEVHEIYLARELTHADRGDFELHAEEAEMETFWLPLEELLDAVLDGRVRQGPLAQAVLAYDVLKRRGKLG
ncbi:NUDIX hydrolase [Nocardioides bigeumensis]|uniref:NUDIX hydrolase n=1 Tax=Nocardioides bigeumensis TaxID=433657 RepID=A0ABN2Y1U4_9ACTN